MVVKHIPSSDAVKMVSECGMRPSPQRIAVAEYVLSHRCHPTAEEIYCGLKSGYPSLSRTTVYNTLHALAAHSAVLEVNVEPGITRFDGFTSPHAHFRCTSCGRIYDLEMTDMDFPHDFHVSTIQLNLTGECPECGEPKKKQN